MIAFLTLCYCGLIWLIFFKLKLMKFDRRAQVVVVTVGVVAIFLLLLFMGLYQPYAKDAVVAQRSIPIVPRVDGRIVEIPIKAQQPVSAGDVLFRIDPEPYKRKVESLEAQLAEAEQNVKVLGANLAAAGATEDRRRAELADARQQVEGLETNVVAATARVANARAQQKLAAVNRTLTLEAFESGAATDIERDRAEAEFASADAAFDEAVANERAARLAFDAEIGGTKTRVAVAEAALRQAGADVHAAQLAVDATIRGENTAVARLRADLERARIDLDECTVYAPSDGVVTQLFAKKGSVTSTVKFMSVMTFLPDQRMAIWTPLKPNAARHVAVGDLAEIAFRTRPGEILTGTVVAIVPATGEGEVSASGALLASDALRPAARMLMRVNVDEITDGPPIPGGTGCAVAVYTDRGKPIRIIRKVIIRIQAWMNYL